MSKIYLAGPMTGIPLYNYPAFDAAAEELRKAGHFVFSPADNDRYVLGIDAAHQLDKLTVDEQYAFRRIALAHDLEWICRYADAIALLPGYEHSTGAMAELYAARALKLAEIYVLS